jgi:hypothetical protein
MLLFLNAIGARNGNPGDNLLQGSKSSPECNHGDGGVRDHDRARDSDSAYLKPTDERASAIGAGEVTTSELAIYLGAMLDTVDANEFLSGMEPARSSSLL